MKGQITCSNTCKNKYFRGERLPNWNGGFLQYRQVCFQYHEHRCAVCSEELIIEVHHMDGNYSNCTKENLIPLCPTHHKYIHHKKYSYLVEDPIKEYINKLMRR